MKSYLATNQHFFIALLWTLLLGNHTHSIKTHSNYTLYISKATYIQPGMHNLWFEELHIVPAAPMFRKCCKWVLFAAIYLKPQSFHNCNSHCRSKIEGNTIHIY